MTVREWLRKLLEDVPRIEVDSAAADGQRSDFFVSNPPIDSTGPLVVAVDGVPKTTPADFTLIDTRGIQFASPPAADAQVVIQYQHYTWDDAELDHYIEQATKEWTEDRHVVYRAAIYAIDSLLIGMATSLRFGAGAEEFDLPSVFERLKSLRDDVFLAELTRAAEESTLEIVDVSFPSRDPSYPGGFYGGYSDGEYDFI